MSRLQCFHMIAYPEKRCPKEGSWIAKLDMVLPPVDKFVWCDDHKFSTDELIEARCD